jgi:anti-sigma factor RsiW
MNPHDIEPWILLRESGELDPASAAELDAALAADPALRAFAESLQRLGDASRAATVLLAPPLPELNRARILREARIRPTPWIAPFLAAAAAVLLGLGLWQMQPKTAPVLPETAVATHTALAEDPVLSGLEDLDTRLSALFDLATLDEAPETDVNTWAEELLALEERI